MPATNEVSDKVAKVLVQALGVEEEEITPGATLQGDLGAESIDFLDIVFRLEREFMIKIHQDELFPNRVLLGSSAILKDGRLTDDGLAALHAQMPYADWRKLASDRRLERIDDLFTVDLLASFVQWKLNGSGTAGTGGPMPAPQHSPENPTLSTMPIAR